MTQDLLFRQILDYSNRANPYPLYRQLRQTPVARLDDGAYVVSTYREIVSLFHDPRISSDPRHRGQPGQDSHTPDGGQRVSPSFIRADPPQHDRLRRQAMRPFGPPHSAERIDAMRANLFHIVDDLIDQLRGRTQIDIVDDFAYPFPVTVICELLGVPREDEVRFRGWAEAIITALDPTLDRDQEQSRAQADAEMSRYLTELIEEHRRQPGDDLLSALATDDGPDGRMSPEQQVRTAKLLLIAGHETTVNLITNGMLTLLRHPDVLERLRRDPELVIPLTEELLRYEPPVHLLPERTAIDDIPIGGTTIAKGSQVILVLAAGSRDPDRFPEPDRFDPDREDNQHLGFASGIHYCFGAPLARLEEQIALSELAGRLENPRLVADPPPYRQNAALRGPRHLLVEVDGVRA
jgi:cytochrome P450